MTCQDVLDRLDDFVDGTLPEAEFQEVELHLAGCEECEAEHRFLRQLLAKAAELPRAVPPPRDLWPGIAGRLATSPAARPRSYWMMGLAAAAAVLVAVTVAVRPPPSTRTPAGEGVVTNVSTDGLPRELVEAEREYERATAQLLAALAARSEALPPEIQQGLDQNLRAIDQALVEVRAAVRADPTNPRLNHLLASTHQRKVETLRRIVKLTT
jgi:anti-sigma factor RsiW